MNIPTHDVDEMLRRIASATLRESGAPEDVRCPCGADAYALCRHCGEAGACAVCLGVGGDGGWLCRSCGNVHGYVCAGCLAALHAADPLAVARHYQEHDEARMEVRTLPALLWRIGAGDSHYQAAAAGKRLSVTGYRFGQRGPCWIALVDDAPLCDEHGCYREHESARAAMLAAEAAVDARPTLRQRLRAAWDAFRGQGGAHA